MCVIDPRIRLTGGPDYCDIEITRVTPSDYGTWDCLVNEIEEVSSDQAQIALEVSTISFLTIRFRLNLIIKSEANASKILYF